MRRAVVDAAHLTDLSIRSRLASAFPTDPSKGEYLFPPSSLTASEFSALKSSQVATYTPVDPVALQAAAEAAANTASSDNYYKVGSYVKAAKEASDGTYYLTHESVNTETGRTRG